MADKLKVLIPSQSYDTSIGKVTLAPFKFKQFPQALKLVERYSEIIFGEKTEIIEEQGVQVAVQVPKQGTDIAREIFAKSETDETYAVLSDIEEMLALVSGGTLTDLDDLGYDEVVALLIEVIQMNMDFFSRIGKRLNTKGPDDTEKLKTGTSASAA
jgi:hypothetical protein